MYLQKNCFWASLALSVMGLAGVYLNWYGHEYFRFPGTQIKTSIQTVRISIICHKQGDTEA